MAGADNVILIVDDDVITIDDDAGSSKIRPPKSRLPRSNKIDVPATIICLDDDDKDEEEALRFHELEAVQNLADREALRFHDEAVQNLGQMGNSESTEDVEARQKQRIEDLRNARNKDRTDMQSKDRIRESMMQVVKNLELRCLDMASLLKVLGFIASESQPSPDEVRLAYKKALLTFHPDRASGLNIQKQVVAEETFKVISRAKERFSPEW